LTLKVAQTDEATAEIRLNFEHSFCRVDFVPVKQKTHQVYTFTHKTAIAHNVYHFKHSLLVLTVYDDIKD